MRSREQKNRHPIRSIRALVAAVGSVALVMRLGMPRFRTVTVRGESMTPTLRPGERVLVWNPTRRPRVDSVVVYRDRFDDRLRVKRVTTVDDEGILTVAGDNVALSTSERDLGSVSPAQVLGVVVLRQDPGRGWARLRYDPSR